MTCGLRTLIWLCWILCYLAPYVEGQFRGGGNSFGPPAGFGPGGPPARDGGGFRGDGPPGGDFGPNRFGQGKGGSRPDRFGGGGEDGRQGGQRQEAEAPPNVEEQRTDEAEPSSTALSPAAPATPANTPAVPAVPAIPAVPDDDEASAPLEDSINVPAVPSSTEAPLEQPTSVANPVPEPASTTQPLAGIPLVAPAGTIISNIAPTTAAFEQIPSTTTSLPTVTTSMTTSMTVWVTSTPLAETTAASAEEGPPSRTEANLSPSSSPGTTMSASQQAGMGIGITFGLLSVAGATGLYLWRRRRNQGLGRDNLTGGNGRGGLVGFFRVRSRSDSKPNNDPEWSIESASKVEIRRGGSAKSIRTGSRSDSPPSVFPVPNANQPPLPFPEAAARAERKMGGGVGLEVVKVGMRVPDRKPNLALTSNPPISPSAFPTPPNSGGKEKRSGDNTSSWPLPE